MTTTGTMTCTSSRTTRPAPFRAPWGNARRASLGALIALLLVAGTPPARATEETQAHVAVSDVRRAQLTHRTIVHLAQPVKELRVHHARPVEPAWRAQGRLDYIGDTRLVPGGAAEVERGTRWSWELKDLPAGDHEFVSSYDIEVAARRVDPSQIAVTWGQLQKERGTRARTIPLGDTTEFVRSAAAHIRSVSASPAVAVHETAKWLASTLEYDASVPYRTDDLEQIVAQRKGHCGHHYQLFGAVCEELGLSVRVAFGFSLGNRDGLWDGHSDWNRHTWAEVLFPGFGWVEVEPVGSDDPFAIPWRYVRNDPSMQAIQVRARDSGAWEIHTDFTDTVRVGELEESPLRLPLVAGTQCDAEYSAVGDGAALLLRVPSGTYVVSPAPGRVVAAGREPLCPFALPQPSRQHDFVALDHGRGRFAILFGLRRGSLAVRAGDIVDTAHLLARSDRSTAAKAPHVALVLCDVAGRPTPPSLSELGFDPETPFRAATSQNAPRGETVFRSASLVPTDTFASQSIRLESHNLAWRPLDPLVVELVGKTEPGAGVAIEIRALGTEAAIALPTVRAASDGGFRLRMDLEALAQRFRGPTEYSLVRLEADGVTQRTWLPIVLPVRR